MAENYSESMFKAIDTIIAQRLNGVSYDKTELCTIVSQNKDDKTRYWVTNEAGLKYEAYSLDGLKTYANKAQVYVTVPQGNYELRKIILGGYTTTTENKFKYTNPFDEMVTAKSFNFNCSGFSVVTSDALPNKTIDIALGDSNRFTKNGLGLYEYIGLEFSATTGFGGNIGEFWLQIDFLKYSNEEKTELKSLIEDDNLKGLLTLSSKQLYGNPCYLHEGQSFQHLFDFPLVYGDKNFSDLTQVDVVRITLFDRGGFDNGNTIAINNCSLHFGYDKDSSVVASDKVALVLDRTYNNENGLLEGEAYNLIPEEYASEYDKKEMSIDWYNFSETSFHNEQKPYSNTSEDYYVYWLRYSASTGYTKILEETNQWLKDCAYQHTENVDGTLTRSDTPIYDWALIGNSSKKPTPAEQYQAYCNNLQYYFPNVSQKTLSDFKWLWGETIKRCGANLNSLTFMEKYEGATDPSTGEHINGLVDEKYPVDQCLDIQESGTYWKTVKKTLATAADAFTYTLSPDISRNEEQIKVAIKSKKNGYYQESKGLTFNQVQYVVESVGVTQTLKFTFGDNSKGVHNSYGIDNRLLSNLDKKYSITVDYIDNTEWEPEKQIVEWRIPANNSMITPPYTYDTEQKKDVLANNWILNNDKTYYVYTSVLDDKTTDEQEGIDAHTIEYQLDSQYGFNKNNNTIECRISHYDSLDAKIGEKKFFGTVDLRFGTQGVAGTGYSFNIIPEHYNGLKFNNGGLILSEPVSSETNKIPLNVKLEDDSGNLLTVSSDKVKWRFLYNGKEYPIPEYDCHWNQWNNGSETSGLSFTISAHAVHNFKPDVDNDIFINFDNILFPTDIESKVWPYLIVVAELEDWTIENGMQINLKAYYPVPFCRDHCNYSLEGPTRIVYNSQGIEPSYDKTAYQLYSNNVVMRNCRYEIFPKSQITTAEYLKLCWAPTLSDFQRNVRQTPLVNESNYKRYDDFWNDASGTEGDHKINFYNLIDEFLIPNNGYYPYKTYTVNLNAHSLKDNLLSPLPMLPTVIPPISIFVYDSSNTLSYMQPILTLRNGYESSLLNSWAGALTIDEKNNYILSALMGAGVKNPEDNTFSGILMGQVGNKADMESIENNITGLYGLSHGELRYKLDEKGSFYVGTGNDNFISFNENVDGRSDNNELLIKTNEFNVNTPHMDILASKKNLDGEGPYILVKNIDTNKNTVNKVKIGKLDTGYGIEVYDGAFTLFSSQNNSEKVLYVDSSKGLRLNGELTKIFPAHNAERANQVPISVYNKFSSAYFDKFDVYEWAGTQLDAEYEGILFQNMKGNSEYQSIFIGLGGTPVGKVGEEARRYENPLIRARGGLVIAASSRSSSSTHKESLGNTLRLQSLSSSNVDFRSTPQLGSTIDINPNNIYFYCNKKARFVINKTGVWVYAPRSTDDNTPWYQVKGSGQGTTI